MEISSAGLRFDDSGFGEFFDICRVTLHEHAPRKRKYTRGNYRLFINKSHIAVV